MAVIQHLQAKSEAESARGSVGSAHGDVIVVLAMASTVSDADMRHSKTLVPRVKQINPGSVSAPVGCQSPSAYSCLVT